MEATTTAATPATQQAAQAQPVKVEYSEQFLMSPMGQEMKQFELHQRLAKMYCTSTIVPESYRGLNNMGNVIIAMDMAKRLNANLLMIMQNLNVIQGRPAWSSQFLISTVNSCGRFAPLKYKFIEGGYIGKISYNETVWDTVARRNTYKMMEFDGSKIKNVTCIAYTTEKGGDQVLESSPIDIRTAILEGWYTKKGSKWPNMTRQMLMYRAASFWTKAYAPELSMGISTSEEVRDVEDAVYEEIRPEAQPSTVSFDKVKAEAVQSTQQHEPQQDMPNLEPSEVEKPPIQPEAPAENDPEQLFS